jgi:hypothetical protein
LHLEELILIADIPDCFAFQIFEWHGGLYKLHTNADESDSVAGSLKKKNKRFIFRGQGCNFCKVEKKFQPHDLK